MISKFHFFAAALAGVFICTAAGAQVHTGGSTARRATGHMRPATKTSANPAPTAAQGIPATQQPSVLQISSDGRVSALFVPTANSFYVDTVSGVPGLGFDFPHLAAINGALGNNPSFHSGHNGRHGKGSFVPILFGGYPYDYDDSGSDQADQPPVQPSQPQPQIIVVQQPVAAQQNAESGNDAGNSSASGSASQADAPIPDVGNFILVRRDGRIFFASVFSVVGAQLQYVTPEGIRRTLEMSDLDADATQDMNEARGTEVQFHN